MSSHRTNPAADRSRLNRALTVAIVLAGAVLAFHGLDNHPFWDDEAQTAILARNLMKHGELTGWDGTNVVGFEYGRELDEDLQYVKIPPQHFYIAAAGMTLFGETTFGGRAPFVVVGLLTIAALAWWARRFFGEAFPWWLPALLLALSPAFLLFIRNCRYFSPGIFWTVILAGVWAAPRLRVDWRRHALAALATAGLFTNHYIYAVAALGALPVFFLDARNRTRKQCLLAATIYAVGFAFTLHALVQGSVSDRLFTRNESVSWIEGVAVLFSRSLRDVGPLEFIAWPMILPLALPWIVPRLRDRRDLATRGGILVLAILAYLLITAAISQQPVTGTTASNARYYFPVIAFGAMIGGASLAILWQWHRAAGTIVAVVFLVTNLFYLIPARGPFTSDTDAPRYRSRLTDYVRDNAAPYRSAYTPLIGWAESLSAGTRVHVVPHFAAYPLMFYRPDLRYCEQLEMDKVIRPEVRAPLPDYLFAGKARPEVFALHPGEAGIPVGHESFVLTQPHLEGDKNLRFVLRDIVPTHWRDKTRPEIPDHLFAAPPEKHNRPGFAIYTLAAER